MSSHLPPFWLPFWTPSCPVNKMVIFLLEFCLVPTNLRPIMLIIFAIIQAHWYTTVLSIFNQQNVNNEWNQYSYSVLLVDMLISTIVNNLIPTAVQDNGTCIRLWLYTIINVNVYTHLGAKTNWRICTKKQQHEITFWLIPIDVCK